MPENFTCVFSGFTRAVRQVGFVLMKKSKPVAFLLIRPGRRQDGETVVCLENGAGGLFNMLLDLFVGILSRNSLLMATAPGMNALVAGFHEQPKHLGDFCLSV